MKNSINFDRFLDVENIKSLFAYSKEYKNSICLLTTLNILLAAISISLAFTMRGIIDASIDRDFLTAKHYAIIFAISLLSQLGFRNFAKYKYAITRESMKNSLQRQFIHHYSYKTWLSISPLSTGNLLTRFYDDINNVVVAALDIIPTIISLTFKLLLAFILLAKFDLLLALLILMITPTTILISFIIGRRLKTIQHKILKASALQKSRISETIHNLQLIKVFRYEDGNLNKIKALQEDRYILNMEGSRFTLITNTLMSLGHKVSLFTTITLGSYRLYQGLITFGTFTAFMQLISQIRIPIQNISSSIPSLIATFSSIERLREFESLPKEIPTDSNIGNGQLPLSLSLQDVEFSYNQNQKILNHVNLQINSGQRVGLVGMSGEGKTTIANLLMGLFPSDKGSIILTMATGEEHTISPSTREYFSYVPQVNVMFSGTIWENLQLDHNFSDKEIAHALKASCSESFINNLTEGLDSNLGENGLGLSQGQIQRLCIARSLLDRAPFIILDEATSALDISTEKDIIHNLNRLYPHKTLIFITHREEVLNICTHVYELRNGSIYPQQFPR